MNNTTTALWQRLPQARISLVNAFDLYETANRARNLSPSTIRFYRERIAAFIEYLAREGGGDPTLNDFTPQSFRMFILEKQGVPKYSKHPYRRPNGAMPSPAYIHGYFRVVRSFSSWLFAGGLTPVRVMRDLKLPRLDERELEPLTPEEELTLLNAYSETKAGESRDKAIFMLMLSTGIRRGEVISVFLEPLQAPPPRSRRVCNRHSAPPAWSQNQRDVGWRPSKSPNDSNREAF